MGARGLKFDSGNKLLVRQDRRRAVSAFKVALPDRLLLAWLKVGEWVNARAAVIVLLCEPDLIAPEQAIADRVAKQRRIVRVEDQLSAPRVRLGVLEQADEFCRKCRVKTRVEFVSKEDRAGLKRLNHRADQPEPNSSSERLVLSLEWDLLAASAAMQKLNTKLLEGRPLVALWLLLDTLQNPYRATKTLLHDWIRLSLSYRGYSEVGGLKQSQHMKVMAIVTEHLCRKCLPPKP